MKMNPMVRLIRKAVRAKGYDMIHYSPWKNLFAHFGIDMILDVGANIGQSYDAFRWSGFNGPICSFEPNPEMFAQLQKREGRDWQRFPFALSNHSGQVKFHITDSDNACGLQTPLGHAKVVREITVPAYRLDELWGKQGFSAGNAFLKIDAEGHDLEVIKGATGVLDRIPLIMAEISPLPRFEGEPPLHEVVNFMDGLGYRVCRVEKNSYDAAAGIDTALDIVFARRELLLKRNGK